MNEYQEIAQRLRRELAELVKRAQAVEEELSHPLDADSSEQAVDLADDESLEGLGEVLRGQIRDIQQAMLRIDRGEYGTCANCGGEIGLARLKALPTATRCIACAD
ncbi:hypothetical protein GCM10011494_08610 [Novosphingobium endophyticum]|uniref:TraR/DksA family transcriptional regulator n=1 Tax=Novosphingobium endophyticum TaxID=1955250 RepID=A0A916TQP4_9SPHN|nr:TraR/DksA family transcriptional regulator [Novosphingobium endophyticum]GGB92515.1 hypothetical protein GCM10011494_08610 [Novosphingobium endophyticum]